MNDLLKTEFNSTEAALRHLESNEFKEFLKNFKISMDKLDRHLKRISNSNTEIVETIRIQNKLIEFNFDELNSSSKRMADEIKRQTQTWESFLNKH